MPKRTFFTLLFLILVSISELYCQSATFDYDASGNCVLKYKTVILGPSYAKKKPGNQNTDTIQAPLQESLLGERKLTIYPNPTKGVLKIEVSGKALENQGKYIVTDLSGKIMMSGIFESMSFQVDMTTLPEGGYFIKLMIENKQDIWKIIKE
ncbi:MAG: T9SS type A sorting domain-containing protein [Paludibacter sp.]